MGQDKMGQEPTLSLKELLDFADDLRNPPEPED